MNINDLKSTAKFLDLLEDALQDKLNAHGVSVCASETVGHEEIALEDENGVEIARYAIKVEQV